MKCIECNTKDKTVNEYFLPIYVLLGFLHRRNTHTDMSGVHYEWLYVFTPLGKTIIKSYFCHSCKQKLIDKDKKIKNTSIIVSIIAPLLIIGYSFLLIILEMGFYYYLLNILFCILIYISIGYMHRKKDYSLIESIKKSDGLKDEVEMIGNKINLAELDFLKLTNEEKEAFKSRNEELKFSREDLAFVLQKSSIINSSISYGTHGNQTWFIAKYPNVLNNDVISGGYRLQRTTDYISESFQSHYKEFTFKDYNKICEL